MSRRRFGQHFLAPAWADKVAAAIAPQPDQRFLEIGPGPGVLTTRLAGRAAQVTAVEIDRRLAQDLRRNAPPNLEIVEQDFLDFDLASFAGGGPFRVAGNLPYNISSPILFKLLDAAAASANLLDATVMLQREVADRLAARPGTKDYGVLTIFIAAQADVTRLLTLPPGAFRPPPRVDSAVVRLAFKPSVVPPALAGTFARMVRTMFMQRRKTLGNALRPFADTAGRTPSSALAAVGIDPMRRPETLTMAELLALAGVFGGPGSDA
ncbi:MAG TPA: 16S rRNA (adenine(1518)-N(6)/adenine(1519)-N(6))-dimethyltransferase RsmA [Vicinamibacterales bacterium]|nr:16S rRNA (adenine(1518)-N(6)/adenine(1519)-N(6))-dimethyltransferase RsmA [Vicinamibacterales bacterium]